MATSLRLARRCALNWRTPTYCRGHKILSCMPSATQIIPHRTAALESTRLFATTSSHSETLEEPLLDNATYERVCTDTLDGLCDYFEELMEEAAHVAGSDVSYGDGVLTIKLGKNYGTYVINRQTPNKQIWLSSPTSGPKRYDFVGPKSASTGKWIYKHTGESMHELLQHEMSKIFKAQVDFLHLPYSS